MTASDWRLRLQAWARQLKRDVVALWLASRDPRTPLWAKVTAAFIAAYALSPIDLIPDFIPVVGYLDDVIILPLGIMLAVRLIPADLMLEFRIAAADRLERPSSKAGLVLVVSIWVAVGALGIWWLFH